MAGFREDATGAYWIQTKNGTYQIPRSMIRQIRTGLENALDGFKVDIKWGQHEYYGLSDCNSNDVGLRCGGGFEILAHDEGMALLRTIEKYARQTAIETGLLEQGLDEMD